MPVTPRPHIARPGLTLIEMLVIVAVLGLVASLVLSATQAVREAARRLQCQNNLKQIGLAIHQYHAAVGALPPGQYKSYDPRYAGHAPPCTSKFIDRSFLVHLLPYLEQRTLYDSINHNVSILGWENATAHVVAIDAFACPDDRGAGYPRSLNADALISYGIPDPSGGRWRMVFTSYSGCFGYLDTLALPRIETHCKVDPRKLAQNNGCFNDASPITYASITDGLANTIFVAEKDTGLFGRFGVHGSPESVRYGWYVTGNFGDTLFTTLFPPNGHESAGSGSIRYSASSSHPDGLNLLMGDGSARFVTNSIDSWPLDPRTGLPAGITGDGNGGYALIPRPGLWQALSSRSGGEIVTPDVLP